ncbi:iron-containing redox enzyme family protein, partial [Acinetobacter pittii]
LQERVQKSHDLAIKICKLTPFLAPDTPHKSIGLWSTRKYVELLFPYLSSFNKTNS